jgi:hypothetical protein
MYAVVFSADRLPSFSSSARWGMISLCGRQARPTPHGVLHSSCTGVGPDAERKLHKIWATRWEHLLSLSLACKMLYKPNINHSEETVYPNPYSGFKQIFRNLKVSRSLKFFRKQIICFHYEKK